MAQFERKDYNFTNVTYRQLRFPKLSSSDRYWDGNVEFGLYIPNEQVDEFMAAGLPVDWDTGDPERHIDPRPFIQMKLYANMSNAHAYIVDEDEHKVKLVPPERYSTIGKFRPVLFNIIAYPWEYDGRVLMSIKSLYCVIQSNPIEKLYAGYSYTDLDTGAPIRNPYAFTEE